MLLGRGAVIRPVIVAASRFLFRRHVHHALRLRLGEQPLLLRRVIRAGATVAAARTHRARLVLDLLLNEVLE